MTYPWERWYCVRCGTYRADRTADWKKLPPCPRCGGIGLQHPPMPSPPEQTPSPPRRRMNPKQPSRKVAKL